MAQRKEIISFEMQKTFVGGGDGSFGNPFTFDEFQRFGGGSTVYFYNSNNEFCYNLPEVTVTSGTNTSYIGGTAYVGGTAGYQGGTYSGGTDSGYQGGTSNYSITYRGTTANSDAVSETSISKLKELMDATGDYSIVITSTSRSPYDQARIMYENISNTSVSAQKKIYGSAGDQVY